jgi:hypothetical protein
MLVDCDPKRLAGISSSETEKALAHERALAIRDFLWGAVWPPPILADSGNGWHLLYRIDLPPDDGEVVKRCLHALAARFDDARVSIDTAVFNPARIVKLYGTMARKGDSTPERPHRFSRLVEIPNHGS